MEKRLIDELIPKVMAGIGAISKSRRNTGQGYSFRGIEDALNAVHPVLCEHGVSLSFSIDPGTYKVENFQEPVKGKPGETRLVTRATLLARLELFGPDGYGRMIAVTAGEGIDYGGDKATNKAMSAAMKYGLFFGLAIPTKEGDELDDSDKSSQTSSDEPAKPRQKTVAEILAEQQAAAAAGSGGTVSSGDSVSSAGESQDSRPAAVAAPTTTIIETPASVSVAPAGQSINGPCSPETAAKIKELLAEIDQVQPGTIAKVKDAIAAAGLKKVADLTVADAERLQRSLELRQMDEFFRVSLVRKPGETAAAA